MDKYGDTVYGAEPCGVRSSLFSNFTCKGNTLYVHAHFWPGKEWAIGGLKTKVKSAKLLCTGESVEFDQNEFRVRFKGLPEEAPAQPVTVLAVECESTPTQDMSIIRKGMPREGV